MLNQICSTFSVAARAEWHLVIIGLKHRTVFKLKPAVKFTHAKWDGIRTRLTAPRQLVPPLPLELLTSLCKTRFLTRCPPTVNTPNKATLLHHSNVEISTQLRKVWTMHTWQECLLQQPARGRYSGFTGWGGTAHDCWVAGLYLGGDCGIVAGVLSLRLPRWQSLPSHEAAYDLWNTDDACVYAVHTGWRCCV